MKFKGIIIVLVHFSLMDGNIFSQTFVTDTAIGFSCSSYLDTNLNQQVYLFADQKAEFPNGEKALMQFISTHTKFPNGNNEINGTVFVEFVIGEDGNILRKAIRRSIEKSMDEEALRMLDLMPKWIPAQCEGKSVPFLITIPVKFIKK
jgi:TonB family protein